MALTDISGIGAKTAEKLREDGITSKQDLFRAFRQNDSRVVGGPFEDGLNKRALAGIREALTEQGESFVDPVYGIPTTPENREAIEAFDLELGSDVAQGFGSFTRDEAGVDADMNVLEAAGAAVEGDLGPKFRPPSYDELKPEKYPNIDSDSRKDLEEADEGARARKEAFEFGLDAAANITPFERDTIEAGNQLAQQTSNMGTFTAQQKETIQREVSDGTIQAEENIGIGARNYAKAQTLHQNRSERARDVDNQRKAEIASDYDQWAESPNSYDYPGVDTPGQETDFVNEQQREQAKQIEETIMGANEPVVDIAFGDPISDIIDGR